jgi:hypothetical protein
MFIRDKHLNVGLPLYKLFHNHIPIVEDPIVLTVMTRLLSRKDTLTVSDWL